MYCTINDIIDDIGEKTLIELTDDSDVPQLIDETLVTSKIEEMSHYIDGYLNERYPLPIMDADDLNILRNTCVGLVVTELYRRRLGLDYSDSLQARRAELIDNLVKIQRGVIKLKSGASVGSPRFYRVTGRTRHFDENIVL